MLHYYQAKALRMAFHSFEWKMKSQLIVPGPQCYSGPSLNTKSDLNVGFRFEYLLEMGSVDICYSKYSIDHAKFFKVPRKEIHLHSTKRSFIFKMKFSFQSLRSVIQQPLESHSGVLGSSCP